MKLNNEAGQRQVTASRALPTALTALTLRVQQPGDSQLSLGHAEGLLQVLLVALAVHLGHVDQGRPARRVQLSLHVV